MNPSTDCVQAIQRLRQNPDFRIFVDDVRRLASGELHKACAASSENRIDQTSYARAIADFWVLLEAGMHGVAHNKVARPPLEMPQEVQGLLAPQEVQDEQGPAPAPGPADIILGTSASKGKAR